VISLGDAVTIGKLWRLSWERGKASEGYVTLILSPRHWENSVPSSLQTLGTSGVAICVELLNVSPALPRQVAGVFTHQPLHVRD
jgi:hypothetical protein